MLVCSLGVVGLPSMPAEKDPGVRFRNGQTAELALQTRMSPKPIRSVGVLVALLCGCSGTESGDSTEAVGGRAGTTTTVISPSGGASFVGSSVAAGGNSPKDGTSKGGTSSKGGASQLGGNNTAIAGGGASAGGATGGTGGSSESGGTRATSSSVGGMSSAAGNSAGGAQGGRVAFGGRTSTGGTSASSGSTAVYRPCPTDGSPCKVLPLGDSITWGVGDEANGGYRGPLFGLTIAANKRITFTGSLSNGPSTVSGSTFPKRNEGHSGWGISTVTTYSGGKAGIATLVPSPAFDAASGGTPNIILMMIGTNDAGESGATASAMSTRLGALMNKIIAAAPNATLVVAKITPWVTCLPSSMLITTLSQVSSMRALLLENTCFWRT
ncbi:MAG: GDSL-type esterase/lipase family protein [Polyangiaceae bacterium]